MKRIIFILSLIFMIGIQAKAQSGTCIGTIYQDPTQGLFYTLNNSHVLPIDCAFVTPKVVNGYTESFTISKDEIELLYSRNKENGYYDIPVRIEDRGNIYSGYIRIQFIKK